MAQTDGNSPAQSGGSSPAQATEYPLHRGHQLLRNSAHPSVGGMLALAAPMMGHETKTHAFQWCAQDGRSIDPLKMGDDKFLKLFDLQSKTLAELFSFAEENGAEDASTMRKEQLMFAITQMFAQTPIFEGKVERVTTIHDALAGSHYLGSGGPSEVARALKMIDDIASASKAPSMASPRNHEKRRSTVLHLEFHKIQGLPRC